MTKRDRRAGRAPRVAWLLAAGLAACTNGDGLAGVGGGAAGGSGDLLVQDAPVNDLLSFAVDVAEVRLVDPLGAVSTNLLSGVRRVELLGLQGRARWLESPALPEGTWSGVRFTFDTNTISAVAKTGASVPVTATSGVLSTDFAAPVVIDDPSDYERILVDVDLAASLTGDMTGLVFTPAGTVGVDSGVTSQEIDEFRGTVLAHDTGASTMTVRAYVDDDLTSTLGDLVVTVATGANLYRVDGLPYASTADFFGDLVDGATTLEVHGSLGSGGAVTADEIHIEDHDGGTSSANEVELDGILTDLGAGTFDLRVAEVEKGAAIADPVLQGLPDPTLVTVSHDGTTDFVGEDGTPASAADLAVGQRVKVRFGSFVAPPFLAGRVKLDMEAGAEVVVTDVSGLPGQVIVHVDADEPWVTSGAIANDTTDVTVFLSGASVFLDVPGDPTISAADIEVGLELRVEGDLSGTDVTASRVEVHPGRLEGEITAAPSATQFTVTVSAPPDDPFGANVDGTGPYTLMLATGALVEGDATSGSELKQLFDALLPGEQLLVEVRGLGTEIANEIEAYRIEAEVQ